MTVRETANSVRTLLYAKLILNRKYYNLFLCIYNAIKVKLLLFNTVTTRLSNDLNCSFQGVVVGFGEDVATMWILAREFLNNTWMRLRLDKTLELQLIFIIMKLDVW